MPMMKIAAFAGYANRSTGDTQSFIFSVSMITVSFSRSIAEHLWMSFPNSARTRFAFGW